MFKKFSLNLYYFMWNCLCHGYSVNLLALAPYGFFISFRLTFCDSQKQIGM